MHSASHKLCISSSKTIFIPMDNGRLDLMSSHISFSTFTVLISSFFKCSFRVFILPWSDQWCLCCRRAKNCSMVSPLRDGPDDGKNKGGTEEQLRRTITKAHFPSVFSCFYTKIKIFESVLEDNGFFSALLDWSE